MKTFFQVEPTKIFYIFDIVHISVIFFSIAVIAFLIYKRESFYINNKKDIVTIGLGIFLLFLDISFYIWKYINGEQTHFPIPMHVCSWATYITALALILRNKQLFNVSIYYGFTGGMLSILVPEFGGYSFNHMRFYQFFFLHLLLIIGPLYLFYSYKFKVEMKYLFYTFGLIHLQALIAFPVNAYFTKLNGELSNMMFVNEPPAEVAALMPPSPYHLLVFSIIFLGLWLGFYKLLNMGQKHSSNQLVNEI